MPEFPEAVRAAVRQHTDAILALPNVIGVGAAHKVVGGQTTDEPGLVAYVVRKLPADSFDPDERIPDVVETSEGTTRTDVVEIGQPRLIDVDNASYRPLRGGCQIQTSGGTGTAGAVIYDARWPKRPVLLTNNHVLTDTKTPFALPDDRRVWQPAGGPTIGESKRIVPMLPAPLGEFGHNFEATVDAGIVGLLPNVDVQFDVIELGRHPYVVLPVHAGLEVAHRGFRTQHRTGRVEATDLTIITQSGAGPRCRIGGHGCVFSIRAPANRVSAMPGDSGSLVVDADGQAARGLVFSSSNEWKGGLTFACDLAEVMRQLELESACTGGQNWLIYRAVITRVAHGTLSGDMKTMTDELIDKTNRFRHRYLCDEPDGRLSGALGGLLRRLSPDLVEGIEQDEDLAGLLDRAIGDWLVLPTVYEMLEYRLPDSFADSAIATLRRLCEVQDGVEDLGWLEAALQHCVGRTMRELLETEARGLPDLGSRAG